MKLIIEKQYDLVGGERLESEKIKCELYWVDNTLYFEVGDNLYLIPKEALFGILKNV